MKKKVNILLSTYNGEKYIETQLQSLLDQTYENIDIYIRDDNSSDNTMDIVKCMQAENKTSKNIYIVDTEGINLGYPDCFWELLSCCKPADYYSFCDQDDYWFPKKIETAVNMMENPQENKLFFHDYEICNEQLKCNYVYQYQKDEIKVNDLLFCVFAQGFSIVITDALKQEVLATEPKGKNLPHDIWCLWLAFIKGEIVHTEQVLAKYRRYEGAVTTTHGSLWMKIKGAFANELVGDRLQEFQYRFDLLLDIYKKDMKEETRKALERYSKNNRGVKGYFSKLCYPKRIMPTLSGELIFRLAFLIGKI